MSKNYRMILCKLIARALRLRAGDRIPTVIRAIEPGESHQYRMPKSFAGVAPHAYGGDYGSAAFIRAERDAWDE